MKTTRRPAKRKKSQPKAERPQPAIIDHLHRKLTDAQKARYKNPLGRDRQTCASVDGKLVWTNPFDELLGSISDAIDETIPHDVFPPDGNSIHEWQKVKGQWEMFIRRRSDDECRMAHFGLILPDPYFNAMSEGAYEAAAVALEDLAKLITDAAARVRKLRKKKAA